MTTLWKNMNNLFLAKHAYRKNIMHKKILSTKKKYWQKNYIHKKFITTYRDQKNLEKRFSEKHGTTIFDGNYSLGAEFSDDFRQNDVFRVQTLKKS